MKIRIITVGLFCFFAIVFAEGPPPTLIDDAYEHLPLVLETIFDSDETEYGFETGDRIEDMQVGKPFRIHNISTERIEKHKPNDDVESLKSGESELWYSILYCQKEPRVLLTLQNTGTKWEIVSLNYESELAAIDKLLNKHAQIVIYEYAPLRQYFFNLPEIGNHNLSRIANANRLMKASDRIPNKAGSLDGAVQSLRAEIRELKRHLPEKNKGGKK
jgi:hypothetical protein